MNVSAHVSDSVRAPARGTPINGAGGTIRASSPTERPITRPGTGTEFTPAIPQCSKASLLELVARPTAVSLGRRHVREAIRKWALDDLADDAELLASEMLTNAVQATSSLQSPDLLILRLLANTERLVIEVYDHSPVDPAPRRVDDESESGRGFVVVEALADSWDYRRFHPGLKVVWAELRIPEH
jgi:anti-sigma regulatory factor (Ser/Thr protein kinase)